MYNYELFYEYMERYELGERELSAEEKKWREHMQSSFGAQPPSSFETFLGYMEEYNKEKSTHKHI